MENVKVKEEKKPKPTKPEQKPKKEHIKMKPKKNMALANFMEDRNKKRKIAGMKPAYTEDQIKECK